jgi:hypothetical protein
MRIPRRPAAGIPFQPPRPNASTDAKSTVAGTRNEAHFGWYGCIGKISTTVPRYDLAGTLWNDFEDIAGAQQLPCRTRWYA